MAKKAQKRRGPKRIHKRAETPVGSSVEPPPPAVGYDAALGDIVGLLESARRTAARTVNAVMTATYWLIGRRIVEFEQGGKGRAKYGQMLLKRLSEDLGRRFGRGFGLTSLKQFRSFYLTYPGPGKGQTASDLSIPGPPSQKGQRSEESPPRPILQTTSEETGVASRGSQQSLVPDRTDAGVVELARRFPLPWSHYVRLLTVRDAGARRFYEAEALRGGWTVRQLDRQISSRFYERTLLSKNKAAMLRKGAKPTASDVLAPEEEIKEPFVLEFLGLRDEYSESDLEEALIRKLEQFLLELGGDFAFVSRQRRLRIGNEWYRVDLLFFHRRLRCLVVIDLKVGKFTHADAGQMHLYLNYARESWIRPGENPPVGLILCAQKDDTVAHYALGGLPNKVLAAEYRMALPDERLLADELARARKTLETQQRLRSKRLEKQ